MKNITKPMLIASILIIIIALVLQSPNLLIIATSLTVLYKLFSPLISKIVFDSTIFKSVLVFFGYILLMQCTVLIGWVLNHNFPLTYIPALLLLVILLMYGYNYIFNRKKSKLPKPNKKIKLFNLQDILSVAVAVIMISIITLPLLILTPIYKESAVIMSAINGNIDDSSHLSLINDNLQFDRGVVFKSDADGKTRNGGFYPAGWHGASSILIKTLDPNIKTGADSLLAYAVQKLFWFFILIYSLVRVSFVVFRFITNKVVKRSSYFWITSASLFLGYTLLMPISKEGFYSLLPQLIAALLTIPILIQICIEKDKFTSYRILPLLFLVCIGGCLAWFLPLPAFALMTLFIVLLLVKNKKISVMVKNIFNIIKSNLIILLLLFSAVLIQFYIMSSNKTGNGISFIEGILLDGGITQYSKFFYLMICVGFIACLVMANKIAKKNIHILLSLIISLLLFCVVIFLIQFKFLERNAYYYYKTLDILSLTAIPFCITGFGLIIDKITDNKNNILSVILSIIFIATAFQMIDMDKATMGYSIGYRAFDNKIDNSIINEFKNNLTQDNYFNKKYSFYYVPDSNYYFQNEVSTMMTASNTLGSTCFNDIRHSIWKSPPVEKILNDIEQSCNGYDITIVTNQTYLNEFQTTVTKLNLDNAVKIKSY